MINQSKIINFPSNKKSNIMINSLMLKSNSSVISKNKPSFKGNFLTKIKYPELCTKERFSKILDMLDSSYKEYFESILEDLKNIIEHQPHLFKDMPDEVKFKIQNSHVVYLNKKGNIEKLTGAVISPITSLVSFAKNLFSKTKKTSDVQKVNDIKKDFLNIEGLVEFVENSKEKDPEKLKKLIEEKIKKGFSKTKANYSSNLFTTMIDLASFLVSAAYQGADFYNITRRADDNHEKALKEAKIKIKQDSIRLVMLTYLTYIITSVFKKGCNKSMLNALATASVIQAASEIVNRKITGRPVLPINDTNFQKYMQKEGNKILSQSLANTVVPNKNNYTPTGGKNIFSSFMFSNQLNNKSKISFKGLPINRVLSKELTFPKNDIINVMRVIKEVNPSQFKRYTELIEREFKGVLKGRKFEEICADDTIQTIPLGQTESTFGRLIKSIFIPITALVKFSQKLINKKSEKVDDFIEIKNYLTYTNKLLKTKYKDKDPFGNKDIFNSLKKDLMDSTFAPFRTTEANYNTANYAIIKRIFSYSIFTTAIASDAFNVTMLHTNADKEKSKIQAKQRVIQEITRFFISIYTASASLTMFGGLYNKTILNAFLITCMTSIANNALTRKILGLPILPKTKEQLIKLDEQSKKSKFHSFINKLTGKET